jgi:hypothetical protein
MNLLTSILLWMVGVLLAYRVAQQAPATSLAPALLWGAELLVYAALIALLGRRLRWAGAAAGAAGLVAISQLILLGGDAAAWAVALWSPATAAAPVHPSGAAHGCAAFFSILIFLLHQDPLRRLGSAASNLRPARRRGLVTDEPRGLERNRKSPGLAVLGPGGAALNFDDDADVRALIDSASGAAPARGVAAATLAPAAEDFEEVEGSVSVPLAEIAAAWERQGLEWPGGASAVGSREALEVPLKMILARLREGEASLLPDQWETLAQGRVDLPAVPTDETALPLPMETVVAQVPVEVFARPVTPLRWMTGVELDGEPLFRSGPKREDR